MVVTSQVFPRTILVPLDGSDLAIRVLPYVRALAEPETDVLLLQVLDPIPDYEVAGTETIGRHEIRKERMESVNAQLSTICDELLGTCTQTTPYAAIGDVAGTILGVAAEHQPEFIVMATQGRGALGRILLGSVADRIARSSVVPVLLINPRNEATPPPSATAEIDRIIVLLDGSQRARNALPLATSLASQKGIPVHLIRVVPFRENMDAADRYYEGYCTAASDALKSEVSQLQASGVDASSELLIGPTVPAIQDALAGGDLVVMTSHGEGGIRRWQLGSVAEKLINLAAAPILLVPDPNRVRL